MSIATAITNAQGKVANAYTAVSGKGGTLPATQDLSNLPTAINSITELKGQTKTVTSNGTVTPDSGYNGLTSVTVRVTATPKVSFKKAVGNSSTVREPFFYDSIKNGNTPPSGAKNASAAYTGDLPAQSTIWWYSNAIPYTYNERIYMYYSGNTITFGI